ncbi:MAG: hypothetical protein ACP5QZ_10890 [Candidatus Sumerlaeaceae bacterium]
MRKLRLRWIWVWFAVGVVLVAQSTVARMTDELPTTHPAKKYHFVAADDGSEWAKTPWGRLGVAKLATAPFPDDSRTSGFVSKRGVFPYEGHYDDNRVAMAVPTQILEIASQTGARRGEAGREPLPQLDLIVHFHGHFNECLRAVEEFHLGEQLRDSDRLAILVVPQGPKYAPDNGGGKLEKEGAFAAFVAEVMDVIRRNEICGSKTTRLGRIILSGHSGAYRVMANILDHGGAWDQIAEVWLFDAAYGFFDELALPATFPEPPKKRLRSIFTDHLATENVQIMSRLCLAGEKLMVVHDEGLTTAGTYLTELQRRNASDRWASVGAEALDLILRQEPYVFIYTNLGHNELLFQRRYFERFARSTPNLRPAK